MGTDGVVGVVQLPHPGAEHPMPASRRRPWMPGNRLHKRTFLQSRGTYRESPEGPERHGDVAFWGEWEAAVEGIRPLRQVPRGPAWLCRPDLRGAKPETDEGIPPQNTDPYVWGDAIRYTFCRQPRSKKLRALGRGSLVLFGSGLGEGFVLDTVLVVREWIEHRRLDDVAGAVDDAFRRWTLEPMYGWGENKETYRLYLGATPEEPVDGMFSFVPCRPVEEGLEPGFARPVLELDGLLNPNLRMAARVVDVGLEGARAAWEDVVRQVLECDLALATRLELPAS
jgi:hypothetical protein